MADTCHLIITPDPRQDNVMQTSSQPHFDIKFGDGPESSTYRRTHSNFAYSENKLSKSKRHEVIDHKGQLRYLKSSQYLEWLVFGYASDDFECEASGWHRLHARDGVSLEYLALFLSGLLDEFSTYNWDKTRRSRLEDQMNCVRDCVTFDDPADNLDDVIKTWLGQGKKIRCIS